MKSTALAILRGVGLDDPRLTELFAYVAIVGSITTENHGVEHLVKNVIANPYLRHLVIWGDDVEGHLPGDALLSLSARGVDGRKRIIGARGARPVLKNLTENETGHFRKQVKTIDLIGRTDSSLLAGRLEWLEKQAAQPYAAGLKVDLVQIKKAKPAKRLKLDPAGYFVVMTMEGKEYPLLVEHYSNDGRLRNRVAGKDAASICATLIENRLVSQLDHDAYLGREIVKAEISLSSGWKYVQDKAQGKLC